jgi:Ca2+-transporting ATPase
MELFWLNLATDVFPALGLAMSPVPEARMAQPPPDPAAPFFDRQEIRRIGLDAATMAAASLAVHLATSLRRGPGPVTRGATFLTMALTQISHGLMQAERASRGGDQAYLRAGIAASTGLLAAPFAVPSLRRLLGIAVPSVGEALLAATAAAVAASASGTRPR